MTASVLPPAEEFPAAVRFRNGRTRHRVRVPDEQQWWTLLEAACGKTGYSADAWLPNVPDCRACTQAVAAEQQVEQAA